jgi:hypothetical protein
MTRKWSRRLKATHNVGLQSGQRDCAYGTSLTSPARINLPVLGHEAL